MSEKLIKKTHLVKRAAYERIIFREMFCRNSSSPDFLKLLFQRVAFFCIHARRVIVGEVPIEKLIPKFERFRAIINHSSGFKSIIENIKVY